jgi:hypothetical protein
VWAAMGQSELRFPRGRKAGFRWDPRIPYLEAKLTRVSDRFIHAASFSRKSITTWRVVLLSNRAFQP